MLAEQKFTGRCQPTAHFQQRRMGVGNGAQGVRDERSIETGIGQWNLFGGKSANRTVAANQGRRF